MKDVVVYYKYYYNVYDCYKELWNVCLKKKNYIIMIIGYILYNDLYKKILKVVYL